CARSAKDRHRPSISRVTSEARPASSSAPSVSAPLSWLRQSNFSASRSNSKRPEKFTEPFGRLRAARGGRLQQSHLNRVRSSRRLEAECHRNIEVIWLLRTLKPDFKTIADFRSENRAAFKAVFRQFTLLCKDLKLFGRELLAVDGTRIKAVNNKDKNFTRNSLETFIKAADERLEEYLKRLDEGDVEEARTDGSRVKNLAEKIEALRKKRGRYGALLAELEKSGESRISLTDPDSRAMAAHTKVGVGYNIQIAVDAKNKMIVEQEVTNQVVDMGLLTETAEPARAI